MQVGSTPFPERSGSEESAICALDIRASVCLENGIPVAAELVELARMDLLLRVDRPLRFGSRIRLVLFRDFARGVSHCEAIVHWCRAERGAWRLGAFLTSPITESITEHCGTDLRAHLRYPAGWKAWARLEDDGRIEKMLIQDYSIGGICARLPCAVQPGTQLSVFGTGGVSGCRAVPSRVQWCRSNEGEFVIGCFVPGQRGRELPRMFENHDAVHAVDHISDAARAANDPGHISRIEQSMQESFSTVAPDPRTLPGESRQRIRLESDHSGAWSICSPVGS